MSFGKFVWGLRMPYLWIALIAIPLQFLIFKLQYPYPNFRGDSAAYIHAAFWHINASQWPVGYSKFLSIVHFFSHSDTLLVSIQYSLLELSALLLFFTLKFFLKPGKIVFNLLFVFNIFNPMFLHLGNYIMSDALFISLSLLWITQLLWIIYRPAPMQIFAQAILLLCLFTVRYNALFYPLVATLTLILSSLRRIVKIAGISLSFILIGLFIGFTERAFAKLNGVRQFSPFGGWQLANNALYMYGNIRLDDSIKAPAQFFELDSIIRKSFTSEKRKSLMADHLDVRDFYIWDTVNSPLWQYMKYNYKSDNSTNSYVKWITMGAFYSAYGNYLIQKYPAEYFRYFLSPNITNFFLPQIADLNYYNQGSNTLVYVESMWFDYKYLGVTRAPADYELNIIKPYPYVMGFFNIFFLLSFIFYLLSYSYKHVGRTFNKIVILIFSFWLLNFCFSLSASTIEIRYQVFQFILCFGFSIILMELLLRPSGEPKVLLS